MTTNLERQALIAKIRQLPSQLESLVRPLSEAQLNTRFLPNEWTVAQNVHHLADSHMNCLIRVKLILTEEHPTLRPYDQDAWAITPDYAAPIDDSLTLLRGLHARWALLFESLWDCERWTREVACENVEPGRATARLREIEADPFEYDEVREAARTGLDH